jgi:hypothetical protein
VGGVDGSSASADVTGCSAVVPSDFLPYVSGVTPHQALRRTGVDAAAWRARSARSASAVRMGPNEARGNRGARRLSRRFGAGPSAKPRTLIVAGVMACSSRSAGKLR